jgi:hypothetical protein
MVTAMMLITPVAVWARAILAARSKQKSGKVTQTPRPLGCGTVIRSEDN